MESVGTVLALTATPAVLANRLQGDPDERPLIAADPEDRLPTLLSARAEHYASFGQQLNTSDLTPESAAREAQVLLGMFHVRGMGTGYDVRVADGNMKSIGRALIDRDLGGPIVLVSDQIVGKLYGSQAARSLLEAGYTVERTLLPPGERHKTLDSVHHLWDAFLAASLERGSTVAALGGGVIGDIAGFAAATYHRGVAWVVMPTTLLAMVDASLGGKTGIDLPQGKNLVGAFHPPALVRADTTTLQTLPEAELRAGLAEVVKHGVVGDPALFDLCMQGWETLSENWGLAVRRAIAVKVGVIQADPYEQGLRAVLNLGHTIGHAVEQASGFALRHGEAVAIGLALEAQLSERLGVAEPGLAEQIIVTLQGLGLPWRVPRGLDRAAILAAMAFDKKRAAGQVRFALPRKIGEVKVGVSVADLREVV